MIRQANLLPSPRRQAAGAVLAVLLLAACGGRSALGSDADVASAAVTSGPGSGPSASASSGGLGGATTATTAASASSGASSGGQGGAGGASSTCGPLGLASPVLALADADADTTLPWLILGGLNDDAAILLHAATSILKPTGAVLRVRSFDPWNAWPPAAPPAVDMKTQKGAPIPGVSFAASSLGKPQPSFTLFYRDYVGLYFSLAPVALASGTATVWIDQAQSGNGVAFFTPNAIHNRHLALFLQPGGGFTQLGVNASQLNDSLNLFDVGCATTPVAADAAEAGAGWLIGLALGAPAQWDSNDTPCNSKYSSVGPAKTIYLAGVDTSGYPLTVGASIDVGVPVVRLRMASRSDGAWVVFSTGAGPLRVARVDGAAGIAASPADVVGTEVSDPSSFAVGAVGDDLLLASIDAVPGGLGSVVVRRIDGSGTTVASASIPLEGAPAGALSVGAAKGRGALVGWSEFEPGNVKHQLRVARFACTPE